MGIITSATLRDPAYRNAAASEFVKLFPEFHVTPHETGATADSPRTSTLPGYYQRQFWADVAAGRSAPPISFDASGQAYVDWDSYKSQVSLAAYNATRAGTPTAGWQGAVAGASQAIYQLVDSATGGALPNEIAGYRISGSEQDRALGRVPANLTNGLPETGSNIGEGAGNVAKGAGEGAGEGLKGLFSGAAKGLGWVLAGLAVLAVVLILVLSRPGAAATASAIRG